MSRCARGTCSRDADAGLGYNPLERSVWLVDLPADEQQLLALCRAHADNLTVPHGWKSRDERTGAPRLWSLGPAAEIVQRPPGPTRIDHARAKRQTKVEPLELFGPADTDPAADIDSAADADIQPITGARPSLIPGVGMKQPPDELQVGASSPLLARAFRASSAG